MNSVLQDDSGWTPFMIAASVKDADKVADILLARGADVNQTSAKPFLFLPLFFLSFKKSTNLLQTTTAKYTHPPTLTSSPIDLTNHPHPHRQPSTS